MAAVCANVNVWQATRKIPADKQVGRQRAQKLGRMGTRQIFQGSSTASADPMTCMAPPNKALALRYHRHWPVLRQAPIGSRGAPARMGCNSLLPYLIFLAKSRWMVDEMYQFNIKLYMIVGGDSRWWYKEELIDYPRFVCFLAISY